MGGSRALNDSENRSVDNALSGSTVYFSTVARLYKGLGGKWQQQGMGAVAILSDGSSNFIKLVDITGRRVTFTQELYNNFEYETPRPFFHTFEAEQFVAGLSFADEDDAGEFARAVQVCASGGTPSPRSSAAPPPLPTKSAPPPPRASKPPPPAVSSPPPPLPEKRSSRDVPHEPPHRDEPAASPVSSFVSTTTTTTTSKPKPKKKKGNFLTSLLGMGDNNDEPLAISEPSNFRHVSNIGWNPKEGSFEINNIPPEWKKLFQGIGIKKSDLKNKDTAAFIMNVIEEHGGIDAPPPASLDTGGSSGGGGAPPPPPPPPPGGSAPPAPRPPPGGSPGGAAPPPPRSAPALPSSSSTRGGLLEDIQKGTHLRKVDTSSNITTEKPPPPPTGLADTLARAMAERRVAITTNEKDEEDDNDDQDWSDEDWE